MSIIVISVGTIVTFGWIFGIASLTSIFPNFPSMKFSTSTSFVFSGIMFYFISQLKQGKADIAQIAIPISILIVFLFMATFLISGYILVSPGIESIFIKNTGNIATATLGKPSIGTVTNFLLIISYGAFSMSTSVKLRKYSVLIGCGIVGIGSMALVGYVANLPSLYFAAKGISGAMAIHTSILFVMLGSAMILLRSYYKVEGSGSLKIRKKLFVFFIIASGIPIVFVTSLTYSLVKNPIYVDAIDETVLIIGSISTILVTIYSIFISRSIVNPILKIRDVVSEITKGNVDLQADENSSDEVGDLAKSFNKMTCQLKESEKEKIQNEKMAIIGNLSSRMVHDLRNPISTITNSISLLKMQEQNMDDKKLKSYERIERGINRLNSLITDTLDFIRKSPLKLAEHSLLDMITYSMENLTIPNTIKIELPTNDTKIMCDETKIMAVFSNIILNAIQAMDDNGKIVIRINDQDEKVAIEFENTGPEIPKEALPKLFTPLFTTKPKGTGLGLATCKNIVEQHQGTITVNPMPVTFIITLIKNISQ